MGLLGVVNYKISPSELREINTIQSLPLILTSLNTSFCMISNVGFHFWPSIPVKLCFSCNYLSVSGSGSSAFALWPSSPMDLGVVIFQFVQLFSFCEDWSDAFQALYMFDWKLEIFNTILIILWAETVHKFMEMEVRQYIWERRKLSQMSGAVVRIWCVNSGK